jgi:hypothetical protein
MSREDLKVHGTYETISVISDETFYISSEEAHWDWTSDSNTEYLFNVSYYIENFQVDYLEWITLSLRNPLDKVICAEFTTLEDYDDSGIKLRKIRSLLTYKAPDKNYSNNVEHRFYPNTSLFDTIGIHSFSHFQNCIVPPKTNETIDRCIPKIPHKISTEGCLVDMSTMLSQKLNLRGNENCINTSNLSRNAWNSWVKPQSKFLVRLLSFYRLLKRFFQLTLNWWENVCQFFTLHMSASLGKNTLKPQFYSLLHLRLCKPKKTSKIESLILSRCVF